MSDLFDPTAAPPAPPSLGAFPWEELFGPRPVHPPDPLMQLLSPGLSGSLDPQTGFTPHMRPQPPRQGMNLLALLMRLLRPAAPGSDARSFTNTGYQTSDR